MSTPDVIERLRNALLLADTDGNVVVSAEDLRHLLDLHDAAELDGR